MDFNTQLGYNEINASFPYLQLRIVCRLIFSLNYIPRCEPSNLRCRKIVTLCQHLFIHCWKCLRSSSRKICCFCILYSMQTLKRKYTLLKNLSTSATNRGHWRLRGPLIYTYCQWTILPLNNMARQFFIPRITWCEIEPVGTETQL